MLTNRITSYWFDMCNQFFFIIWFTHTDPLCLEIVSFIFSRVFLCVILFLCKMSGVMRAAFNSIDFFLPIKNKKKNALSELFWRKNSNLMILIDHWWRRHFWQVVFFVRLPFEIFVQLVDLFFFLSFNPILHFASTVDRCCLVFLLFAVNMNRKVASETKSASFPASVCY